MLGEGGQMIGGGVSLVPVESILGIGRMQCDQGTVPGDLGENGRGADAGLEGVATDDGARRAWKRGGMVAIHPHLGRRLTEPGHGALHGEQTGLKNVDPIDLPGAGLGDAKGQRALPNQIEQGLAPTGRQFLGVVQTLDGSARIEDDRCRKHGTRKGTTPRLVNTGHPRPGWGRGQIKQGQGFRRLHNVTYNSRLNLAGPAPGGTQDIE